MTTETEPSINGVDVAKIKGRITVGNMLAVMQMAVLLIGGIATITSVRDRTNFVQEQIVDMKSDFGHRIDGLSQQVSKLDDRLDSVRDHAQR